MADVIILLNYFQFSAIIAVESIYVRWKLHNPILYGSDHKSDTALGWMLKHMPGWWVIRKRFCKASLLDQGARKNWTTKTAANVSFSSFLSRFYTRTPHASSSQQAHQSLESVQAYIGVTAHPPAKHSLHSGLRMRLNFLQWCTACWSQHALWKSNIYLEIKYILNS